MLPRQSLPRLPSRAVEKQLPRRRKTAFRNYLLPDGIFFFPPCVYGPRNDSETLFKKDSRAENLPFEVFCLGDLGKHSGREGGGEMMQESVSANGRIVVACPTRRKKTKMILLKFFYFLCRKSPLKGNIDSLEYPFFRLGIRLLSLTLMDPTLKRRGKEEEEWPDNNGTESVFPLFPHSSGGQSKKGNLNYVLVADAQKPRNYQKK